MRRRRSLDVTVVERMVRFHMTATAVGAIEAFAADGAGEGAAGGTVEGFDVAAEVFGADEGFGAVGAWFGH
jgi:hypothetical protein